MTRPDDARIAAALLALAQARGAERSFCPSEVARALSPEDWRPLMPEIRRIAGGMKDLRATQKGRRVDAVTARGPIRLHLCVPRP